MVKIFQTKDLICYIRGVREGDMVEGRKGVQGTFLSPPPLFFVFLIFKSVINMKGRERVLGDRGHFAS